MNQTNQRTKIIKNFNLKQKTIWKSDRQMYMKHCKLQSKHLDLVLRRCFAAKYSSYVDALVWIFFFFLYPQRIQNPPSMFTE